MSAFSTPAERFLRDMIAIPSVTGQEGLMKDYLEGAFSGMGLDVEMQPVDGDRFNVIGRIGAGPIKLMLCTHMDVIPAPDVSLWQTPPFQATYRDGKIFGRGSTDAKGQLAAMMAAMGRSIDLDGVALAAVVEEETGRSLGANKLLEHYRPEIAVIGEPTGLRVAIAHKGAIRPVITVHGRASHSSRPESGVNAINIACEAMRVVNEHRGRVMQNKDPLLGAPSLEVTMVRGGDRINVTPERCEFYVDRRLVSNETIESASEGLRKAIEPLNKKPGARVDMKLLCAYPSTSVDEGERVVRLVQHVLKEKGLPFAPVGFPAGCDMWAFRARGVPTVVLGAGDIAQAHIVDEYIDAGELHKASEIYEATLRLLAGYEK